MHYAVRAGNLECIMLLGLELLVVDNNFGFSQKASRDSDFRHTLWMLKHACVFIEVGVVVHMCQRENLLSVYKLLVMNAWH